MNIAKLRFADRSAQVFLFMMLLAFGKANANMSVIMNKVNLRFTCNFESFDSLIHYQ